MQGPVDFNTIAWLQDLIHFHPFSKNAYRLTLQIDFGHLLEYSAQLNRLFYAGPGAYPGWNNQLLILAGVNDLHSDQEPPPYTS